MKASEIKHRRHLVQIELDDAKIEFFFERGRASGEVVARMHEAVQTAIKSDPYISGFLDAFYDEDAAVRYQNMLQSTLRANGLKLLTTDEVSLYTMFIGSQKLTEEEFRDNFSVIESTLGMDEGKREAGQIALAEEIRGARGG